MLLCCFPEQGIQLAKAPILCWFETKLHFHVNKIIKCDHNNCKILLHSIMLLCCFPEEGIQLAKAPILCWFEAKLHFHVNKITKCDHNNCKILLHSIMLLCCFPEQGIQLVVVLHKGYSLDTNNT